MMVLVTGATGKVGSRFVPRLLTQAGSVRILVRDAARAESLTALGAETIVGDLRDPGVLDEAVKGVGGVVHLGATFRGATEEEMTAVNHTATTDLAKAALQAGVARFVYTSTNLVYGAGRGRPVLETDEPAPLRAYPASKVNGERALLELQRGEGLPLRIVRLAFVYGDRDPHLRDSLMWARSWALHKRLHLVHHADVAQALLRALWAEGVDGRVYNVADDAPITAWELMELNGEPIPDDAASWQLDDAWEGIVDTNRIRKELGFRPIYPTVYSARDAGAL